MVELRPILFIMIFFLMVSLIRTAEGVETKQFIVNAGSMQTFTLELEPGDTFRGSFSVSGGNNDVNFWVSDPAGKMLYPQQGVVSGRDFPFTAERAGAYVITFDNSFSIITDKMVTLSYEIESPYVPTGGGGCLIATATYGTELAPEVQKLREIRDNILLKTESGTSFMTGFNEFYYSFSPAIADLERQNPVFKEVVKMFITPMISTLSIMTLAEQGSEEQVIGLGISLIALNLGMYIVGPTVAIVKMKTIFKKNS